jgi:hypothetical protein
MWFEIWIEFEMIVNWIWNDCELNWVWIEVEFDLSLRWIWMKFEVRVWAPSHHVHILTTECSLTSLLHAYRLSKSLQQKKLKGLITTPEPQHSTTLAALVHIQRHATNKTKQYTTVLKINITKSHSFYVPEPRASCAQQRSNTEHENKQTWKQTKKFRFKIYSFVFEMS